MRLESLGASERRARLARGGLALRVGPFTTRLSTPISDLAAAIGLLYADFPVVDGDEIADFHIRVSPPRGVRRWWRPQSVFLSDGRVIFKPFPLRLALPLLEWGWNWCISTHAHRYLIVHCAVIERAGRAALLPAPPGSGKSTLCAALVHRGWRLLSDELALLSVEDGSVAPVPRPVSLNESIDVIRRFAPDAVIGPLSTDTHKGTVAHMRPPADSVTASDEPSQVAWIIFPRFAAGAPAVLEPMPRSRAFLRLVERPPFNYATLGILAFNTLAELFDGVETFAFTYGRLEEAVGIFAALDVPRGAHVSAS